MSAGRAFLVAYRAPLFASSSLWRSALAFARQPIDSPAWAALKKLEQEHRALLAEIATRYHDFSNLDERFHRLINDASRNRFMEDFLARFQAEWESMDV